MNDIEIEFEVPPVREQVNKETPNFMIKEDIDSELAENLLKWLGAWSGEDRKQRLSVFINSAGGDFPACTAIAEAFKLSPNPIRTVVTGAAYSGAALIAAAGDKGQRYAYKSAGFLIHQLQLVRPKKAQESLPEREQSTAVVKRVNEIFMRLLAQFTGKPIEQIKRDTRRDKHLNTEEALSYGLIDHIAEWNKE